jgi:hypothetical protein
MTAHQEAEIARLRRVVERYARHDDDCAVNLLTDVSEYCDCGCDEATYMASGVVPWGEDELARQCVYDLDRGSADESGST